jgi:hypothetical protein
MLPVSLPASYFVEKAVQRMTTTPEKTVNTPGADKATKPATGSHIIDREAPAGTKNSLGEESVRDGRPSTQDNVVEAIDEMDPGTPA